MKFYLLEAKADIQRLIDFAGQELAQQFLANKQRIKPPENDIYYWLKRPLSEFEEFMKTLQTTKTRKQKEETAREGAELVSENDFYKVYHITTFEAAKKYGAHTKWCITGKESGWTDSTNENQYWKEYTDQGIEFYFFIPKTSDNMKYALAKHSDIDKYEIFDEKDESVKLIPQAPVIKGIYEIKYIDGMSVDGTTLVRADKSIVNADIPEGVKAITGAFVNCTNLTSVTIPDSVIYIGYYAFAWCTSLKSVTIPNSVTSIERDVFYSCTSLTSVTIPDSVKTIGDRAFKNCPNLTIKCSKESYAEQYAKEQNIPYKIID